MNETNETKPMTYDEFIARFLDQVQRGLPRMQSLQTTPEDRKRLDEIAVAEGE